MIISSFSDKNVNFINNLLDCLGNFKSWNALKTEFKLADSLYFSWMQLINAIPLNWKTIIKHNCSSANLSLLNHYLIKKNNLISLDKLHSREVYNILVYTSPPHKPTSQVYFENLFREQDLNWKEIYILPRKVSLDCNVRSFQYKVLNNVLYLNKKLFILEKRLLPYVHSANKPMKQYFTFSMNAILRRNYRIAEADSGLVKLVVMTNIFFNNQQHKIKWFICVKQIRSSFFCNN